MARFLNWGDLHNEFWHKLPDYPEGVGNIDAVLVPGDVSSGGNHVECLVRIWDMFRVPVIAVRGNHEFYKTDMDELMIKDQEVLVDIRKAGADIHILDRGEIEIAGARILGATLWTDMDLFPGEHKFIRDRLERGMNDFRMIRKGPVRQFSSGDWLEMHFLDREFLLERLADPFEGNTLVMTHHVPVREAISPLRLIGSPSTMRISAGFASDMWWQIRNLDIHTWIFGHSHDAIDKTLEGVRGPIRFTSNPRGYPKEECNFNPALVVEVPLEKPEPSMFISV